jgi:hypothetical protein
VTVTKGIVDLGNLNWTAASTDTVGYVRKAASLLSVPVPNDKILDAVCTCYKTVTASETYHRTQGVSGKLNGDQIYIYDERFTANDDTSDFTVAVTGEKLVYPLATPIELDLTPAQLTLLQGYNIITADGAINLTYLGTMASNVQAEIDEFESGLNNVIGSIAFIENSTAKTSHAVGDYVILNGIFCKVIASVSAGETLSFGTNIQATTIGAELRAIWAEISA